MGVLKTGAVLPKPVSLMGLMPGLKVLGQKKSGIAQKLGKVWSFSSVINNNIMEDDMCSIAIGGLVMGAAGQAFKVFNGYQQDKHQAGLYKYQAGLTEQQTMLREGQQRDAMGRQLAQQRLGAGARGVQMGGSALDSMVDQRAHGEWQVLSDRYQGNAQSKQLRWQAKTSNRAATMGLITGGLGVGSSLLRDIDNRLINPRGYEGY